MYKATKKTRHLSSLQVSLMRISLAMFMAFTTPSALSTALNTAPPIKIEADYMAFDLETGKNLYEGNVSIVQGNIELTGDKVTILRSNDKVSDIDVTGNPARYLQDESTDNIVNAMSQKIHYSAQNSRLVLTEKASLEQSDHTVESERIIYDTAKKVIIAGKANAEKNDPEQRVNITLTPPKDKPENKQMGIKKQ